MNCVTVGRLALYISICIPLHSIFEVLVIVKTLYEYSLGKGEGYFSSN